MKQSRNVMILASAGSGKTHALTNHFIALLAAGAKPERIVALTFTRKAAGEFFDKILTKLAGAARDPLEAGRLAGEICRPGLAASDFLKMLRSVIDALHLLRLGTIDGFFAKIVRTFPLELGLAGNFDLLQEHAARIERQRVLRRMFVGARETETQAQSDFIEEFKQATFGAEEKRLGPRLDRFLDEHQEIFLAAPAAGLWGNPARIWPQGTRWLGAAPDRAAAIRALREWVAEAQPAAKQRERWDEFLATIETWAPGVALPRAALYVLDKALGNWAELESGNAVLEFDRKRQELSRPACVALVGLVRGVFADEFNRRLTATRGIHAVLRSYESAYHDGVRRAGKLTFADVQRLLQPVALTGSRGEAGPERLFIDFRLDAGIDHWLLDEFQDTSFVQWSILRNLVDEAVQDTEGGRSFFCVGDVKQSIFAWRDGDPQLFGEIFEHYNSSASGTIAKEHLFRSWRSGPPLIEMINSVFGRDDLISGLFPGEASADWNSEWHAHESAVPQNGGHAALLHADDELGRWMTALSLLKEIRPLERGLSCAVLVQKNSTATELADFLRREGSLPAVAESDLHICVDNPLGAALLALVQAAAHPGDRLARGHMDMTPLGEILRAEGLSEPSALSAAILGQIHADGFQPTIERWLRKLEPRLEPADRFTRERARQFAEAAGLFDQTGSRDAAEFVEFMGRHTARDTESASAIRIMTIHKAKGLGFDVVLLPDLEGKAITSRREGLAVQTAADRSVDWILEMPTELFWRNDDVMAAHMEAARAEACYEKLSLLYVAMTRAKRAMYAIIEPVGSSESANFPRLLAETLASDSRPVRVGGLSLAGAWQAGDADWHIRLPAPAAKESSPIRPVLLDTTAVARASRRPARRPSAERIGSVSADRLFALDESAAEFGEAVHALLAEIEWWNGEGERPRGQPQEEVLACLNAPELAGIWRKPAKGAAEVWRERAFEVVLDGSWVTGKFDRVTVTRNAAGRATSATVFDFKTDRLEDGADLAEAAARHAGQLNLYRRAAAVLTGLPPEAVACEVVFTQVRRRVPIRASSA